MAVLCLNIRPLQVHSLNTAKLLLRLMRWHAEAAQTQRRKSFLQPSHCRSNTASCARLRALLVQNCSVVDSWHTHAHQLPSAADPLGPDR